MSQDFGGNTYSKNDRHKIKKTFSYTTYKHANIQQKH